MRQSAASRVGAGRIDRYTPFFNTGNLPVLVHHKRRAVGNAEILDQYPVGLGHVAHMIAEDGVADVEFLFPVRQGGCEIGTDRQNLRITCIEL